MKMKSVYCYMLAGLMLSASSCSSWLSEDDAPVMSYDYYETEAGVNAAITAAYGFLRSRKGKMVVIVNRIINMRHS